MNIFDYAMQMEAESQNYYRNLAEQTNNQGLKTIFNMLADEEAKHYRFVEKMKMKKTDKIVDTTILTDAKAVFQQMAGSEKFDFKNEQLELYRKAQDIEKKSKEFYLQKIDEVEEKAAKKAFELLAKQEEKHYWLLQNIIDFVSRPKTWLENAEWYHLEEY
jgi:rubrerythrin